MEFSTSLKLKLLPESTDSSKANCSIGSFELGMKDDFSLGSQVCSWDLTLNLRPPNQTPPWPGLGAAYRTIYASFLFVRFSHMPAKLSHLVSVYTMFATVLLINQSPPSLKFKAKSIILGLAHRII